MPEMKVDLREIYGAHHLCCPSCGKPVFTAFATASRVPGGGCWLRDGDTVGGLFHRLTPEQKTPSAFDYELLVGGCRACGSDYYVFQTKFINADREGLIDYLLENVLLGHEHNFIVSASRAVDGVPEQWLMHEHQTPGGPMHSHVFGPFRLVDVEGVIGPYGVACCMGAEAAPWHHARTVLLATWNALRALNMDAVPMGGHG